MSTLIDDLLNLAKLESAEDREVQAAVIDQCIDKMIEDASGNNADEMQAKIDELQGRLEDVQGKCDLYRDRFVELYFKKQDQEGDKQQPPKDASHIVAGAGALF